MCNLVDAQFKTEEQSIIQKCSHMPKMLSCQKKK